VKINPPAEPPKLDSDLVQRGAQLFFDPSLSGDGTRACNTCHPGGASDNQFYSNGEQVEVGDASGNRSLQLRGVWQSAPYLWDGSAGSVREALDRMLRVEMRGAQLDGRNLEALEAYVLSIPPFDNGRVENDGTPIEPVTLAARRGFDVFQKAECGVCHRPPSFTIGLRFDIGTGGRLSVPSLRGLSPEGPYGHDGRWETLEDAVRAIAEAREVELSEDEILQLAEYLRLL